MNLSILKADFKVDTPRTLYFIIFVLSGFAGLIYESIWSHYLKLFLGHAAYAQSLVLSIFMGGMALGAWLSSRYSTRFRTPLLMYAIVEGIVGVIALIFHEAFVTIIDTMHNSVLPALENRSFAHMLKWSVAALIITPQSILLGMTFPLMTSGILRKFPDTSGSSIAMLYFCNSIGAAIGVLASGFYFIKAFGLPGTILTSGLINISLAIIVWILFRLDRNPYSSPIQAKEQSSTNSIIPIFMLAAFITGAASFIYEIGWIRMLSLVLGGSTHAFEIMLSAFITGLAFGGLWIRRRIDTIKDPIRFAGYVQIAMAVLAAMTLVIYNSTFDWTGAIKSTLEPSDTGYTLYFLFSHSLALLVMLPATFCAGMTLPLFTHILLQKHSGEKSIGQVYAANTIGSIAGVLFAVHIGLPLLGLKSLITVGALLDLVLGIFLLYKSQSQARSIRILGNAAAGILILAAIMIFVQLDQHKLAAGVFRHGAPALEENTKIHYYKDGKTSSIAIYESQKDIITITTNGKPDASINVAQNKEGFRLDEATMTLAAVLPIAYKPNTKQIANIGMGSGMTTHTALSLEQIEQIDTIEIEKYVIEAGDYFGYTTERAFKDPRSKIHIEDARTFFATENKQYDIIVSEPSNPWVSGIANLFSAEFYQLAKDYLVDDGIFVQWTHLYETDINILASILKAFEQTFSDYVIFNANDVDILIIAKKNGQLGKPNFEALFDTGLKDELSRIDMHSASDLSLRYLLNSSNIKALLSNNPAPANSDYFPYLDQHAVEPFFKRTSISYLNAPAGSQLPIIEMVNDHNFDIGKATYVDFSRAKVNYHAYTILEKLLAKELASNKDKIHIDIANAINFILMSQQDCANKEYADIWLHQANEILFNTLSFLNKKDASKLMALFNNELCPNGNDYQRSWLKLHTAIANRDGRTMAEQASTLLAAHELIPFSKLEAKYLLGAAMLGYIDSKLYGKAVDSWQSYATLVQPLIEKNHAPRSIIFNKQSIEAVPADIIFLVNHAYSQLDSGFMDNIIDAAIEAEDQQAQ